MADQAAEIGYSSSEISAIERGEVSIPEGYVQKVIGWMQLNGDEITEIKLRATMKSEQGIQNAADTVASTLALSGIRESNPREGPLPTNECQASAAPSSNS